MQTLAFPLRLQENGLLRRQDQITSLMGLLQVMARTPAGSWAGCPKFGLSDLLEGQHQRGDIARLVLMRVNEAFEDLGINDFVVTDIVREVGLQRGTDIYAITLGTPDGEERYTTTVASSS